MKRAPHTLKPVSESRENTPRLHFKGPDAELQINSLYPGIYDVRYDFYAYPVESDIESAAIELQDPAFTAHQGEFAIHADGDRFRVDDGNVIIEVDLPSGTLSVFRRGILIHGGFIGSSDTVVPRFPLRVYGAPPRHVKGVFNFPMETGDRFYGLGDKGGSPNRRNRRFLLHSRDALGYRGDFADPLYKSIPFIIKWNPDKGVWLGIAVMATDVIQADFGVESQYFYSFSLRNGPYRYILFTGDSYAEILDGYSRVTGRPAFPPAFTFGFLGSSMDYVEKDDGEKRVSEYFDTIESRNIPCEGLYLSSGYYKSDNGHRHSFQWNLRKFPDPNGFISHIRARGYHVACNLKPGILIDHPRYNEFAAANSLIREESGELYVEFYWGENASFWDFGNVSAIDHWKRELRDFLIDRGVDGIWNDNNEYEIEDTTVPMHSQRSTMAMKMCRASYEEFLLANPGERPWVISRSGGIGIQRYARTWSGDNSSDYDSLRNNLLMGSSMGLSGLPFFGHDVGGFYGGPPDEKQFLHWCQSAVFQPRFVIHSWNAHGKPTELWSFGEYFDSLRSLVLQHYEFLPYTYSQAYQSHLTGMPIQRLLSLEFPCDHELPDDTPAYLYGDAILVLPLVAPETSEVSLRLPADSKWFDPEQLQIIDGGKAFNSQVADNRTRYLLRAPSAVFRSNAPMKHFNGWLTDMQLDVYPPVATGNNQPTLDTDRNRSYRTIIFEDDGISFPSAGKLRLCTVELSWSGENSFNLKISRTDQGTWAPEDPGRNLKLNLPEGFTFQDNSQLSIIPFGSEFSNVELTITGQYTNRK